MESMEKRGDFAAVLGVFPRRLSEEILRVARCRADFSSVCGEIRLRAGEPVSLVVSGRDLPLFSRVSRGEIGEILQKLCKGSFYAYSSRMGEGYFTVFDRVRVGLAGEGRETSGGRLALGNITSLVFRFPSGESDAAEELYAAYRRGIGRGMLIYAPPGGGKTTALCSLAERISAGGARRVVIVDERGELSSERMRASGEVLRGYPKGAGITLAVRSLSPGVLLVDEIGGEEDCRAILQASGCGVPLIATAHAGSLGELCSRRALLPLLENGVFEVLAGITMEGGARRLSLSSAECFFARRLRA